MKEKNPVMMLFPLAKTKNLNENLLVIGRTVSKIVYSLEYDLKKAEINASPERYSFAALVSAIIYGILFVFIGLAFGVIITRGFNNETILLMIIFGILSFFSTLIFHLLYPKIAANQIAKQVDQQLLFALRTLLIQLSSGISLFDVMKTISKGNYGQVSKEFSDVIRDVNTGMSETKALEKLAFKTNSTMLKKTIWQIITTMKSGGSIVTSINAVVEELTNNQIDSIKKYSASLNLWTLIYLIIAAAMPSLGVTFLVIASSIGSSGIGSEAVVLIALLAFCVQGALIFLIKSQVPKVIK